MFDDSMYVTSVTMNFDVLSSSSSSSMSSPARGTDVKLTVLFSKREPLWLKIRSIVSIVRTFVFIFVFCRIDYSTKALRVDDSKKVKKEV